jgi:hypothetical protein
MTASEFHGPPTKSGYPSGLVGPSGQLLKHIILLLLVRGETNKGDLGIGALALQHGRQLSFTSSDL